MWHSRLLYGAVALMVSLLAACGGSATNAVPAPVPDTPVAASVTIDTTASQPLAIKSGQQLDDFVAFDDISGQARLNALKPVLFRIHAGADSDILPEPSPRNGRVARWDFTALQRLVQVAYDAGAQPVMNVRHAPVSLSSCTEFHDAVGTLTDPSFNEFAGYMANLVAYFNVGRFTDASGTYVNPAGTTQRIAYWELWNEPELPYEYPCLRASPSQASLSTAEFTRMWSAATARMRLIDPTIQFVGPSISDPRAFDYLNAIKGTSNFPDIVSAHAYLGPNAAKDDELYFGSASAIGVAGVETAFKSVFDWLNTSGFSTAPVWLDEFNISAEGVDDPLARGWNHMSAALGGSMFIRMARLSQLHPVGFVPFQFVEAGGKRLSSLSAANGKPRIPYWRDLLLGQVALPGDQALGLQLNLPEGFDVMATRRSDLSRISILISYAGDRTPGVAQGGGKPSVTVAVPSIAGRKPVSAQLQVLDRTTDAVAGPTLQAVDTSGLMTVSFDGYGLALLVLQY